MKPLLLIIALLFSTPAWAEEIIMQCSTYISKEEIIKTYRFISNKKIIEVRVDGVWKEYCPNENRYTSRKINASSVICLTNPPKFSVEEVKEYMNKGFLPPIYHKQILDFLLISKDSTMRSSKKNIWKCKRLKV